MPVRHRPPPSLTADTECTLTLDAHTWLPTDDRGLPTGTESVEGTLYDFRTGALIGDTVIDYAFTGLTRDGNGLAWVYLTDSDSRCARLWADEHYRFIELYTGDTQPLNKTAPRVGCRADDLCPQRFPQRQPSDHLRAGTVGHHPMGHPSGLTRDRARQVRRQTKTMPTVNRFAALRLGYAVLLLAAPDLLIRLSTGHPSSRATCAVVQLLGGRHLIQGILTSSAPSVPMLALGAEADLAHALSMLVLAALHQRRRRAELTDAALAATLAVTGAILATRAQSSLASTAG
jgi:Aldose 1-epimerase